MGPPLALTTSLKTPSPNSLTQFTTAASVAQMWTVALPESNTVAQERSTPTEVPGVDDDVWLGHGLVFRASEPRGTRVAPGLTWKWKGVSFGPRRSSGSCVLAPSRAPEASQMWLSRVPKAP